MKSDSRDEGNDAVHAAQRSAANEQGGTNLERPPSITKGHGESLMSQTPDEKYQLPSNAGDGTTGPEFDYN